MKTNYLFLAGFIALGLIACNKEERFSPDKGQEPTGNTYMQIQVIGPTAGIGTKTDATDDGTEEGTIGENTISNLRVILVPVGDEDDTRKAQSFLVKEDELSEISVDDGEKYTGYATPKLKVAAEGEYEVFVIANDKTDESVWKNIENTDVVDIVIEEVNEDAMKTTYAKASNFMMFNESNGSDDIKGEPITIEKKNDFDNPARCENVIRLDRLAVKIAPTVNDGLEPENLKIDTGLENINNRFPSSSASPAVNPVESVTLEGFKLLNGAKKAYLQQHWLRSEEEQKDGLIAEGNTVNWDNTLLTPNALTAETDYYNSLSEFRTLTIDDEGTYTTVQDNFDKLLYYDLSSSSKSKLATIYCMENNSTYDRSGGVIKDALNGNTTGLVFRWKVALGSGLSDKTAGENCFYAYNDEYFTKLEDIQARYPGIFSPAKADITTPDSNPYYGQNQETADLNKAKDELAAAYNSGTPDQMKISDWRVKYNIKVYTEGTMYYLYFIKDQNYCQGDPKATYYSVMRNTVYKLNITGLGGIGTDIPGGWDPDVVPEKPVDNYPLYMIVEVKANPWVISKEDIILK